MKDLHEGEPLSSCCRCHGASDDVVCHVVSQVTGRQPTDKCDEESEHDDTTETVCSCVCALVSVCVCVRAYVTVTGSPCHC